MDSQSQCSNVDPAGKIRWDNFLNPDVVRPTITMISIYLAAFEILKDTLVDRVKGFYEFVHQYKYDNYAMEMHYSADVLGLSKSPLYASLSWLESMEAIDKDDLASFEGVKSCRNELAHELPSILSSRIMPANFEKYFEEMIALLRKVEAWWFINFEMPGNPDLYNQTIDASSIIPGPVLWLRLMSEVALGFKKYYEELSGNSGGDSSD